MKALPIFSILALSASAMAGQWNTSVRENVLEISYGERGSAPQYAALHLQSGYFRMNAGPNSGWGTSVVLMPIYWAKSALVQGYPVQATSTIEGENLVLHISATSGDLRIAETVTLIPPTGQSIVAEVAAKVEGSVDLDARPGESFKILMLSSMHESDTSWDAVSAFAGARVFAFPTEGWLLKPDADTEYRSFGLLGGSSQWKPNAPTVRIRFPKPYPVAGWVTASTNPNDDNVGYWASSDRVLRQWSYTIEVVREEPAK